MEGNSKVYYQRWENKRLIDRFIIPVNLQPLPRGGRDPGPHFPHCSFIKKGYDLLLNISGLSISISNQIDDWLMEVLDKWTLKGQAKILGG